MVRSGNIEHTVHAWMQGLTTMLQHRPIVKLGEAIKCQGEWEITVIS